MGIRLGSRMSVVAACALGLATLALPSLEAELSKLLRVSSVKALDEMARTLTPGAVLLLADGEYSQRIEDLKGLHGTEAMPITIKAEHPGAAVLVGEAALRLNDCSHLVIEGIVFRSPNLTSLAVFGSNHVRITGCTISHGDSVDTKWVVFDGPGNDDNRFDHNVVEGKRGPGQMLCVRGSIDRDGVGTMGQRMMIDHNVFRDNGPRTANGQETLQIGLEPYRGSSAHAVVEYNTFENCDGDAEYISVKSCSNIIRFNTFLNNAGTLTLRQGDFNEVYGNIFIGTADKKEMGGVRVYGSGHRVYCNYFEGLTAAKNKVCTITVDSGSQVDDSAPYAQHRRATRVEVVNNTIVRCASGIALGPGYQKAPSDCRIANNIVFQTAQPLFEAMRCEGIVYEGNLVFPADSALAASGIPARILDPLLVRVGRFLVPGVGSPALGTSAGDYPYVRVDASGRELSRKLDVGCVEVSKP